MPAAVAMTKEMALRGQRSQCQCQHLSPCWLPLNLGGVCTHPPTHLLAYHACMQRTHDPRELLHTHAFTGCITHAVYVRSTLACGLALCPSPSTLLSLNTWLEASLSSCDQPRHWVLTAARPLTYLEGKISVCHHGGCHQTRLPRLMPAVHAGAQCNRVIAARRESNHCTPSQTSRWGSRLHGTISAA